MGENVDLYEDKEGQENLIPIIKRMADQFEPPTEEEFNSLAKIGKEWVVFE